MSECSHDCSNCESNCESRIEKIETNPRNKIKHVIGIVSGKGGVGKSYVTSLLASHLTKLGFKCGILDGDITGPSIPKAFNIHQRASGDGESLIFPAITKSGIKVISSNMLLENEEDPIIWRGSLINSLLTQFYKDVLWDELDYLFIDMPPGTGDVTLTVFQSLPIEGIIIVTSPQDLVSLIVKKAINMAKLMNVSILGIIENMSYLLCEDCGKKIELYGESKIDQIGKDYQLEVLARLPIVPSNAKLIDEGKIEEIEEEEIKKAIVKLTK
ncbi:MAG TPA: Mrp/NBP35 family ATP-binding protein [Candidatus Onthovivens sp.]|nr:Mrp/NBP35 family ATP-binding protein [Candidatus Onthovivens sp.]